MGTVSILRLHPQPGGANIVDVGYTRLTHAISDQRLRLCTEFDLTASGYAALEVTPEYVSAPYSCTRLDSVLGPL